MLSHAEGLSRRFHEVDLMTLRRGERMRRAFQRHRVDATCWTPSTGYGYSSQHSIQTLEQIFAECSGAEAALVRPGIASGTHAISLALRAAFSGPCASISAAGGGGRASAADERYELVSVAGGVYDSVEPTVGVRPGDADERNAHRSPPHGSLAATFGTDRFRYTAVPLAGDGVVDWVAVESAVRSMDSRAVQSGNAVVYVQRSRGYDARRRAALSVDEVERAVEIARGSHASGSCVVVVDNCYCEFVDDTEPAAVGADLMAGSLIKNPGGTIAPCGGYVAGNLQMIERAAAHMTAPGLGRHVGAVPGDVLRLLYQGLWNCPYTIGEALKSSILISSVMSEIGFGVSPSVDDDRHDVITAVEMGSEAALLSLCEALQSTSPVGSHVRPTAGATPGYEDAVVFADGTFVEGSTSEMSADGPMRTPFVAFCQGGSHWTQVANALAHAIPRLAQPDGVMED